MAAIILARHKGQVTKVFVDEEDFAEVSKKRWYINVARGRSVYYIDNSIAGKIKTIYLHRLVLNAKTGEYVDHVDGNTCNNCKENLRITTNQQNCQNRHGAYNNGKTGIRGVSFNKGYKKYEAYYWMDYKTHRVGYFYDIEDAAVAVTLARRVNMPFSEMDKPGAAQIIKQALKENESFLELFQMAA